MDTTFSNQIYINILLSLLVLVSLLTVKWFSEQKILSSREVADESKRRWVLFVRNGTFALIALGFVVVWSNELKTFAVSIAAIAVALVIATKELILCIMGGLLKISTRAFQIGDKIEVGSFRGDVVSSSLMTTTIYEIGPGKEHHQFTGRAITLPNSIFLSSAIINESITGNFVLHVFKIPIKRDLHWKSNVDLLTKIAEEECSGHLEEAKKEFELNAKRQIMEAPKVDPRVHISCADTEKLDLIIRLPTPANKKGKIEQAILMKFIEEQTRKES